MARLSGEVKATLSTTPIGSYDPTKWNLGALVKKNSNVTPQFLGPIQNQVFRPVETGAAIPGIYPWVMQWSSSVDWIFLADNAAAAATRRIQMWTFNRDTPWIPPQWVGYVTLTYPSATSHTIRGFRMTYDKYTTGNASVSGTAVTGTGTGWQASRLAVGSRIGFGSSDPTQIGTWYEISAIGSDNSITLTTSGGTIADGPYVIEELRAVTSTTNATATNGGLFVAKGLRPEIFIGAGTTIPAATTVDNIRAVMWLADAATVTNTAACGCALKDRDSWTQHYAYVLDTATVKVFKYNIRAALTLASGKDTTAFQFATGNQAVTGTISQTNNGRLGTLNHGVGNGVLSLYFVTTTRVYRAAESGITIGSTTWQSDSGTEVPPGGTVTYALTGALACIEIASSIDRLVITSSGATAFRSYVTQYRTDGSQWDHIMFVDDKQLDQVSASGDIVPHATTLSVLQSVWAEGGLLYMTGTGTTAVTNIGHVIAIGADWNYPSVTTHGHLISPKIQTANNNKFASAYFEHADHIGGVVLGTSPDGMKMQYRTSGISDNSGSWTDVPADGDLSGVAGTAEIQFRFLFRVISTTCLPGRVMMAGVSYDDISTDPHYRPSVKWSDVTNKRFAYRFVLAFGGTVPTLRIRLYDDVSGGGPLVDDNSASPTGTWEKSTNDGGAWGAYNTSDKANDTTYIRYTPASLADNIKVRSHLTLN